MSILLLILGCLSYQQPSILEQRVANLEKQALDAAPKINSFIDTTRAAQTNHLARIESLEDRRGEWQKKIDDLAKEVAVLKAQPPPAVEVPYEVGAKLDEVSNKIDEKNEQPDWYTLAGVIGTGLAILSNSYYNRRQVQKKVEESNGVNLPALRSESVKRGGGVFSS